MGIEYYAFALFITGLLCLVAILCKLLFADVRRQRKLLDEKETKLLRLFQTVEDVMEGFNDQVEEAREEIKKHQSTLATREAALRAAAFPEKYDTTARQEIPLKSEAPRYEPPPRQEAPPRYMPPQSIETPQRMETLQGFEPNPGYTPSAAYKAAAAERTERQGQIKPPPEPFRPRPVEVTPARAEPRVSGGVGIKPYGGGTANTGGVTFQRMIDELADDPAAGGTASGNKNGRNAAILQLKEEGKTVAQIARELGITQNEVKLVIGLSI